jgi:RNA polymerase sigma-70 factor (ECF subfamily)
MVKRALQDPWHPLLLQAANGDREAFRALYEVTYHRLTVYLYRMVRDKDSIEDILVETYTRVWENSATFKHQSKVLTWMIGIARHVALEEMRKVKFHENIDAHTELGAVDIDYFSSNRKEVLARAINMLSPKHREILDLAFYQELPYREIALILEINENTVKTRVFYAKSALKTKLSKLGIKKGDL